MDDKSPLLKHSAAVVITALDHENHRVCWESTNWPRIPAVFFATRWQTVSFVDGQTKYETAEVFGGLLAYVVGFFFKKGLNEGARGMGEGLKRRCEAKK